MTDASELLTTRQVAHALGIKPSALHYMRVTGEISPAYQVPGGRGFLWTRAEVERILAMSAMQRRSFRRRRVARGYPMDGLVLVQPRPRPYRPPRMK